MSTRENIRLIARTPFTPNALFFQETYVVGTVLKPLKKYYCFPIIYLKW